VIFSMVPPMGIRLTWTLKTDIKMLILIDARPKGLLVPFRCRTSNIVPSAGVSTASLESEVGLRLGSLKKNARKNRDEKEISADKKEGQTTTDDDKRDPFFCHRPFVVNSRVFHVIF